MLSVKDVIAVGDALRYLKQTSPFQEDWDRITGQLVAVLKQNPGFDEQRFRDYVER